MQELYNILPVFKTDKEITIFNLKPQIENDTETIPNIGPIKTIGLTLNKIEFNEHIKFNDINLISDIINSDKNIITFNKYDEIQLLKLENNDNVKEIENLTGVNISDKLKNDNTKIIKIRIHLLSNMLGNANRMGLATHVFVPKNLLTDLTSELYNIQEWDNDYIFICRIDKTYLDINNFIITNPIIINYNNENYYVKSENIWATKCKINF